MRLTLSSLLAVCVMTLSVAAVSPEPDPARSGWTGIWTNMNNTVHIRAAKCGSAMCGTVIWATDRAKADVAARGGKLIGMQVFRGFRPAGGNEWKGKVYIPDLGQSFDGKLTLTDANSITATGCAFFGVGCQTRHYKRIS